MTEQSTASEVLLAIGRLEGRVEQFMNHQTRQDERANGHDRRIAAVENWQSKALGWLAGGIAVITALWAVLSAVLGNIKIGT